MSEHIEDAEWEEVPGNGGALHVKPVRPGPRVSHDPRPSSTEPTPATSRRFWQTALRSGCIVVLLTFGFILMLGLIAPRPSEDSQATEMSSPADGSSAQAKTAEDMAADWAEFVTGERSTTPFGLADGSGKPGEFCTANNGSSFIQFGGQVLGGPAPDYYARFYRNRTMVDVGAYRFNAAKSELRAVRLVRGTPDTGGHESIPNHLMMVSRSAQGVVWLNATEFHVCVL